MTGLTAEQRTIWNNTGHLTVPGVFYDADMGEAEADLVRWSEGFLATLAPENEAWFLEQSTQQRVLRKLDNPVFHRTVFRSLAKSWKLLSLVEALIGPGRSCGLDYLQKTLTTALVPDRHRISANSSNQP